VPLREPQGPEDTPEKLEAECQAVQDVIDNGKLCKFSMDCYPMLMTLCNKPNLSQKNNKHRGGVSRGLFPRLESTQFPAVSSCSRGKWVVCLFTRLLVLTAHLVLSGRKIVICSLLTFRRFEKTAKEVRKYYLVFEKKWKPPAGMSLYAGL
jgi:hypothetical protein